MKFKIGDVCRVMGCAKHQWKPTSVGYPGLEVTITGYIGDMYVLDFENPLGVKTCSRECCLELKKPPGVELGKWEECPWRPSIEVTHES